MSIREILAFTGIMGEKSRVRFECQNLHVEGAHVHGVWWGVGKPVERVANDETGSGNQREVRIAHRDCDPEVSLGGCLAVPICARVPGDAQVGAGSNVRPYRAAKRSRRHSPCAAAVGRDLQKNRHGVGSTGDVVIYIDEFGASTLGGTDVADRELSVNEGGSSDCQCGNQGQEAKMRIHDRKDGIVLPGGRGVKKSQLDDRVGL